MKSCHVPLCSVCPRAALYWFLSPAAFETTDHHVIAMEYLSGGELYDHVLDREGLAEPEARPMFYQIVSAVQHCHLVSGVGVAIQLLTLAHPPLLP